MNCLLILSPKTIKQNNIPLSSKFYLAFSSRPPDPNHDIQISIIDSSKELAVIEALASIHSAATGYAVYMPDNIPPATIQ